MTTAGESDSTRLLPVRLRAERRWPHVRRVRQNGPIRHYVDFSQDKEHAPSLGRSIRRLLVFWRR